MSECKENEQGRGEKRKCYINQVNRIQTCKHQPREFEIYIRSDRFSNKNRKVLPPTLSKTYMKKLLSIRSTILSSPPPDLPLLIKLLLANQLQGELGPQLRCIRRLLCDHL